MSFRSTVQAKRNKFAGSSQAPGAGLPSLSPSWQRQQRSACLRRVQEKTGCCKWGGQGWETAATQGHWLPRPQLLRSAEHQRDRAAERRSLGHGDRQTSVHRPPLKSFPKSWCPGLSQPGGFHCADEFENHYARGP